MIEDLTGDARACAEDIAKRFPAAKLTSGKRTIAEQALAMAKNVDKDRTRLRKLSPYDTRRPSKWLVATYSNARIINECQDWVDRHPQADVSTMATAFASILSVFDADELRRLSRHLTGEAFDVAPMVGHEGEELLGVLRDWAFRKGGKFLTREGSLVVWHWQAH